MIKSEMINNGCILIELETTIEMKIIPAAVSQINYLVPSFVLRDNMACLDLHGLYCTPR